MEWGSQPLNVKQEVQYGYVKFTTNKVWFTYNTVFIPKYRRKVMFGEVKQEIELI